MRPVWAEVDLDAVAANVAGLLVHAAPAGLCAVVKADGYGHGAVPVARAALSGGAEVLGVALASEGAALRSGGLAAPVIVLSQPSSDEFDLVVSAGLEPTVDTLAGIEAMAVAARDHKGDKKPLPVHLKVDTGMHRVGAQPEDVPMLAQAIEATPTLRLASVFTHCAVADEPENPFTATQIARYQQVLHDLVTRGIVVGRRHAANTAGALAHPAARFDLVRCGIGIYGLRAGPQVAHLGARRPALSLRARVSHVKQVQSGEAISYGLRYRLFQPSTIATVPLGYADGVPRALAAAGGEVLVGGRRRPIAGTVTMDQFMVDCGDDAVAVGDEVVLLGRQGEDEIPVGDWADRLGTIDYEIVCGISPRVPRRYLGATL